MIQIIPAVDVLDGRVVRLMHGDYERVTVYADDPVTACRKWTDQGAALIHVVDLEGARSGNPDVGLWHRLAHAGIRFQVGGGIRSAPDADRALSAGADRVVMGTTAIWDPGALAEVDDPARIVAAVDVRDGRATGAGWLDEGRALSSVLDDLQAVGVPRVLVTGIERDGTMEGPATDLLADVLARGSFDVIASGGVGTIDDIRAVAGLGCEGVIVGRAIYEGRFDVAAAVAALRSGAPPV